MADMDTDAAMAAIDAWVDEQLADLTPAERAVVDAAIDSYRAESARVRRVFDDLAAEYARRAERYRPAFELLAAASAMHFEE
jgi:hypothetical protein